MLDDAEENAAAARHLEECEECRREQALLRRMRMALSAMEELSPPAGAWGRIESALPAGSGAGGEGRSDRRATGSVNVGGKARGRIPGWAAETATPLRLAAAAVLFLAGTWVGVIVTGSSSGDPVAGGDAPPREPAAVTDTGDSEELHDVPAGSHLARLQALRSGGPTPWEAVRHPEQANEYLARLDALIRASREALEESPADPVVNDFLFEVVEERNALGEALHVASVEYR